jgi:hypothetical protein
VNEDVGREGFFFSCLDSDFSFLKQLAAPQETGLGESRLSQAVRLPGAFPSAFASAPGTSDEQKQDLNRVLVEELLRRQEEQKKATQQGPKFPPQA